MSCLVHANARTFVLVIVEIKFAATPDSLIDFHPGYCCGVEISPDYPHAELDKLQTVQKLLRRSPRHRSRDDCNTLIPLRPDIPHFPDGVFQDCRAVQLGYATMVQNCVEINQ